MKKAGYFIMTLGELFFLAAAYIIHYFTWKKMGMARYVIYKNQGWERTLPMEALKYTSVAVLTVLTLAILVAFVSRHKEKARLLAAMHAAMVFLTALYGAYTFLSSAEAMRAYYFISLMLGAAALVQIIKTGAALVLCGKNKNES